MLHLDRAARVLCDAAGNRYDLERHRWQAGPAAPGGTPVTPAEAVAWLQRESGRPCPLPVGVIGTRQPDDRQEAAAERVGELIAGMGLHVLCGGREGVMEACCRGAAARGGVSIGLLPEDTAAAANPHLTVALATGIGIARNALIARAALCLVAVGGGLGTLSEVALGLQFGKAVFALAGAPEVEGTIRLDDPAGIVEPVARLALQLPLP